MKKKIIFVIIFMAIAVKISANEKTSIAILQFNTDSSLISYAPIISNYAKSYLIKSNNFNIVESSMLTKILEEQSFQQTGCVSSECAVEMGNIIGVQKIITGELLSVNGEYSISLIMVDVETGLIQNNVITNSNKSVMSLIKNEFKNVMDTLSNSELGVAQVVQDSLIVEKIAEIKFLDSTAMTTKNMIGNKHPIIAKEISDNRILEVDTSPLNVSLYLNNTFIDEGSYFKIENVKIGENNLRIKNSKMDKSKTVNIQANSTKIFFSFEDDISKKDEFINARFNVIKKEYDYGIIVLGSAMAAVAIVSTIFAISEYGDSERAYYDYQNSTDQLDFDTYRDKYESHRVGFENYRVISVVSWAAFGGTIPFWSSKK